MRFTVRRPASAEVSPCCHRPSGGNVACSVHVGVARSRGAGLALEDRLALTVVGRDMPACRASLRRVGGRDLLDPAVSLVLQARGEQTPSALADTTVEAALLGDPLAGLLYSSARSAGHRGHVKGLDTDRVEAPRDVSGGLFDPVLASVGLARFELRNRQLRASSPMGAALGAGQPLLQRLEPPALTTTQAGGVQEFTGRQCRRHRNTTVNTDDTAIAGTADRVGDVSERNMPATGPITGDPVGPHTLRNWPRQPKAHPADLGHPHTTKPAVHTLKVMRFHPDLPKPFMHTGFAPGRAAVRSGEKVAHRLSEIPQRLLLHGLRAGRQPVEIAAGRGQLSALLVVAGRMASGLPVLMLLNGQVPHIPGMATMLTQHHRLLSGRKQPVSRHPKNLSTSTDKSPKGKAPFQSPAAAGDFHAATIR